MDVHSRCIKGLSTWRMFKDDHCAIGSARHKKQNDIVSIVLHCNYLHLWIWSIPSQLSKYRNRILVSASIVHVFISMSPPEATNRSF